MNSFSGSSMPVSRRSSTRTARGADFQRPVAVGSIRPLVSQPVTTVSAAASTLTGKNMPSEREKIENEGRRKMRSFPKGHNPPRTALSVSSRGKVVSTGDTPATSEPPRLRQEPIRKCRRNFP